MNESAAARRFRPAALIRASVVLHALAAGAVLVRPPLWPWALGAVVADHLLLTAAGLWPRARLLGPNWTHLPCPAARARAVAITIDDGPDPEVTPRVLALLEEHRARATFFCIGERVARYPQLAREIVRARPRAREPQLAAPRCASRCWARGVWPPRSAARSRTILRRNRCRAARFFRAPAGLRNPFLEPVLARVPGCTWSAGRGAASTP